MADEIITNENETAETSENSETTETTVEERLTALETAISSLTTTVSALASRIDSAETAISGIKGEENFELDYTGDEVNTAVKNAIKLTDETCNNLAGKKITVGRKTFTATGKDRYKVVYLCDVSHLNPVQIFATVQNEGVVTNQNQDFLCNIVSKYGKEAYATVFCKTANDSSARLITAGTYNVDYIIIEE